VDGQSHHVLFDGQRRRMPSPADRVMLRALGLRLEDARLISSGLLNTVPEGAAIEWPVVAEAGRSVRWAGREHTVGSVVRVDREAEPTYHLILADGTQLIPPRAVDVVRAASGLPTEVIVLPPSDLASLPVSGAPIALGPIALGPIAVGKHPAVSSSDSTPDAQPGLCMHWRGDGTDPAVRIYPVSRVPLPAQAHAVPVSALTGGRAHAVYVEPQHGLLVRQSATESPVEFGTLFLISDQGIAYPIIDDEALASLGLDREAAHRVPAELISLLPTGPVLDPAAARAGVGPASEQRAPESAAQ
jgi:type VII secretion protein EccB